MAKNKTIPRATGGGGARPSSGGGGWFTNAVSSGLAGLGGMVGRGISAGASGASRGVASLGSAAGSGLAGLVRGKGGGSFTNVIPGNPQPQPTQQRGGSFRNTPIGSTAWVNPLPPSPFKSLTDGGSRSGGGGVGGGGGFNSYAEQANLLEKARIRQANESNVGAYNQAFAEAKQGNESRYQQMLDITNATTGQRAKDIGIDYKNREASAMQNLQRLGMGNTTVAPTLGMGFGRQKNAALDRLSDQMQGTKLGIMERRTDAYPDLASLVSLGQLGVSGLKF